MKNILLPVSIIVLAVSIALGCFFIADAIKEQNETAALSAAAAADQTGTASKSLLSEQEAADYLGLPKDTFSMLLYSLDAQREHLSSYDTYSFIPYLKINDDYFFEKSELDQWVKYNVENHTEWKTD